jgi:outer membrane protein TolC
MKTSARCLLHLWIAGLVFLAIAPHLSAEPLSLKQAVELALSHSTASAAAQTDQQRAFAAFLEARNQYVPQVVVGSGLGASWGFPLSLEGAAPSIFNVNAQSALINPALRDFIRAAKVESDASMLKAKDQREQVMQDTVITYTELVKWEGMLADLTESQSDAQKNQGLIEQRIQAGIDSQIEQEKAELATARAHLRVTQAQGAIDVLREHLGRLTGIPPAAIITVPDSVPPLPEIKQDENLAAKAVQSDPALQAAELKVRAQNFQARGEHRSQWPSVDFAAQYAVLARYNNYDEFYKTFERNNATVGVAIRFPFLNFSQRARAQAADADVVRAKIDASAAQNQVSEQTLKLQRSVEQLSAAQQVAQLEYRLAQSGLETVRVRMSAANANVHDLEDAQTQVNEDYGALQDANFELERARIALLRATGELEGWLGLPK